MTLRRFSLFWAILLSAGILFAAEGMTPSDVARLRNVGAVAISPDGSRVAYTLTVPRDPFTETDGPAWTELHVVGRDGVSRPFVPGDVNVSAVRWTRDGHGISFLAKRAKDEHRGLYLIAADGGEARRLVVHGSDL